MGYSAFDPAGQHRPAWNVGKTVGSKRALKQKEVWAVRFFFDLEQRLRDRALFDLAIDSKLRGCDLVRVRIGDLVSGGEVRHRTLVVQRKTCRGSVDEYAFPSRLDMSAHLSTRQYARLVDEWVTAIGLRLKDYGTHSLRRTKASISTSRPETQSTVHYLGVDVEDALELAEATEV